MTTQADTASANPLIQAADPVRIIQQLASELGARPAQVAAAVGVHETTVSRAIAGKTIATPQGVFEMKFFFTTGYRTAEGSEVSNTSVKDAIAALIRGEDPRRPMSDQQIMERLKADGLPVARRTVAKYREALGILPSHLRKSF